eukprot:1838862-Alexandrium_andersonii.AAC.1
MPSRARARARAMFSMREGRRLCRMRVCPGHNSPNRRPVLCFLLLLSPRRGFLDSGPRRRAGCCAWRRRRVRAQVGGPLWSSLA